MTADIVREAVIHRRPFRFVTADGRTFDVPHPECASLSRSGRLLFVSTDGERLETVDLLLVVSVQESKGLPM
ncbi:MAG: hypothetical protein ACREFX_03205 [Opitutaceae bacterium]